MDLDDITEPLKPADPKKLLFKKKNVKSSSARKSRPLQDQDLADDDGNDGFAVKSRDKHVLSFRGGPKAKSSVKPYSGISKWSPQPQVDSKDSPDLDQDEDGALPPSTGKYNEGDIITAEDLESVEGENLQSKESTSEDSKRFVPQLSPSIERKLSKRQTLNDIVHEYDNKDEYDDDEPDDNYATIEPNAGHDDLQLDSDDELVNDEVYNLKSNGTADPNKMKIENEKYDAQLGDSESETTPYDGLRRDSPTATRHAGPQLTIVTSLTPEEEINKVQSLLEKLTLEQTSLKNESFAIDKQLEEIRNKRELVVHRLVGYND